jgi:hypothetical protein
LNSILRDENWDIDYCKAFENAIRKIILDEELNPDEQSSAPMFRKSIVSTSPSEESWSFTDKLLARAKKLSRVETLQSNA